MFSLEDELGVRYCASVGVIVPGLEATVVILETFVCKASMFFKMLTAESKMPTPRHASDARIVLNAEHGTPVTVYALRSLPIKDAFV